MPKRETADQRKQRLAKERASETMNALMRRAAGLALSERQMKLLNGELGKSESPPMDTLIRRALGKPTKEA